MPLDATGFTLLTLDQIRLELEEEFKDAYGQGIDLAPDSNFGKIIGILADREFSNRQDDQAVYDAFKITASGVSLDDVVALIGITRKPASNSVGTIYAAGTPGTPISAGALFAVQDTQSQFRNPDAAVLGGAGELGVLSLTQAAGVATLQTDAPHGMNIGDYAFVLDADQPEYNGLKKVLSTPAADQITFSVDAGAVSPATGTITLQTTTPIPVESVNTGPIVATAGTLTEVVNFISGLNLIENALDVTPGENAETDAALRERRLLSLSISGGATPKALVGALLELENVTAAVVVENVLDFPDGQGRPAHSFESVVQGGDDNEIAAEIFDNKPAGIETFGSTTVVVLDSNDEPFDINFSRPTAVDIWVEVDLTTTSGFPANGLQLVEDAILAYGLGLKIGDDVIVIGSDSVVGAIGTVAGITDIEIRIGTAVSPTLDNNIPILLNELAVFDSTRTLIVEL